MVSWIISRLVVLLFGTLYPAYSSYKAVKSKDIKEYVKWMMYWIVFALFTTAETFTDIFLSWFPFYFELKIAFVVWLLSPYTKGSSVLYRKFVHPTLSSKEKEIDEYLSQAKDRSYDALVQFGRRGINVAATAAVTAAAKGQGALSERLRSFSMQDLTTIRGETPEPPHESPSVTTRPVATQKKSKSPARGTAETTDKSACIHCSACRLLRVQELQPGEKGNTCEKEGVIVTESSEDEENIAEHSSKRTICIEEHQLIEAPPRNLRPRFQKKSTSPFASESYMNVWSKPLEVAEGRVTASRSQASVSFRIKK
ncbi:receptor expression-enhancing protein 1 isoform X2 [Protopterus annectens]|uniref:receptor expression-enhancing protein 1 isoform X2 n=1 Tax=Protopterus annectens TaxID=7888 RepID=UPI001CF93A8E|nr:receptor expression-enhancing protein 1 isoform X2 [Protopterus annectens]